MNRPTIGKISTDLLNTSPSVVDPQELQRATEKEYLDNLVWAVEHALKKVDCSSMKDHDQCSSRTPLEGDFFIVCVLKKEKLLENVLRNYFIPTKTCPTPFYDQTVFKYNHIKEDIEYLWSIPDKESCEIYRDNKHVVVPQERALLQFVLDFYDGTLYQLCKKLNGETHLPGVALKGK